VLYIPDAWFETTSVKGDAKKKQMVEISERQVPHP
jgi:hypothetical protein